MQEQQQQMAPTQNIKVAPGPENYATRNTWLFWGALVAFLLLVFCLPEPLRDALFWKQPSPLFHFLYSLDGLNVIVYYLLASLLIVPFDNIPMRSWPARSNKKWLTLAPLRQQAAANRFSYWTLPLAPLPEIFQPLPISLSIRVRRNKRVTWLAGTVYLLLMGFVFLDFGWAWQINIQYLAQQGLISGWTFLGAIFQACVLGLYIAPAIIAFFLAPRQRLIATQDGLICYRGLRLRFIPWREAVLFALIYDQKNTLVYELSSPTCLIRWASKPAMGNGGEFPPSVMGVAPLNLIQADHSTEEYQWQIRQLTVMVAAKTGLPCYDLRVPKSS